MTKKKKSKNGRRQYQAKKAIEALLENGTVFETDRKGFLRHFSPKMKLRLAPPTLGVLYTMSGHFVSMEVDEDRVEREPIPYSFILAGKNSRKIGACFGGGSFGWTLAYKAVRTDCRILPYVAAYAEAIAAHDSVGPVHVRYCGLTLSD